MVHPTRAAACWQLPTFRRLLSPHSFRRDERRTALKPPFNAYPGTFRSYAELFRKMATNYKALLDQIRAERKRK
jgi:hypothetical protein